MTNDRLPARPDAAIRVLAAALAEAEESPSGRRWAWTTERRRFAWRRSRRRRRRCA